MLTSTHIQNCVPSRSIGVSPYEKWVGRKSSYERRPKMEVKARKLVFVGYASQQKAFRFLDTSADRITISLDVKFVEDLQFGESDGDVKHESNSKIWWDCFLRRNRRQEWTRTFGA